MKVSLRWMRDYAVLDAPLSSLVQTLVDTGTEVDDVRRDAEGAVVARVLDLTPIPESTHGVRLAGIDAGGPEPVRLVTGAPNVRAGDHIRFVWHDLDRGSVVDDFTYVTTGSAALYRASAYAFRGRQVATARPFEPGSYRVDVFHNGALVASGGFSVALS